VVEIAVRVGAWASGSRRAAVRLSLYE